MIDTFLALISHQRLCEITHTIVAIPSVTNNEGAMSDYTAVDFR